jgi:hypothetical protein
VGRALTNSADRFRPRLTTAVTMAFVLVCSGAAYGRAIVVSPSTVVSFPGVVHTLDYDRGRVAWINTAWALHTRPLHGHGETKLIYTNPYWEVPASGRRSFLDGRRLVWISSRGTGTFDVTDHVYTATVSAKTGHRLVSAAHTDGAGGSYVTGLAGDALGFSYGISTVTGSDENLQISGGGIWNVVAGRPRRVPDTAAAFVFARGAGRILTAPAETSQASGWTPFPSQTFEVRNAATGTIISTFTPGKVDVAALAGTIAVVLRAGQIHRYDAETGQLIGSTNAPAGTAADLDADGSHVVFRTRNAIDMIDATTGRISTVARTGKWTPSAVAIRARTIVWAESQRVRPGEPSAKTFRSRIRAITF